MSEENQQEESQESPSSGGGKAKETKTWGMFLHLSMLANFLIPFGGVIAPIVIWQIKKSDLPGIDAHGKNAVNWIISTVIYGLICLVLTFVIIGIPLMIVLGALCIIFPIIAGVKANNGDAWKYPMSIEFLK